MDGEVIRHSGAVALVMGLLSVAVWAGRRWAKIAPTPAVPRSPAGQPDTAAGAGRGLLALLGLNARFGKGRGRDLKTIDRLALTPQHCLHTVHYGGFELLLATYPQGLKLLSRTSAGAAAESFSPLASRPRPGDSPPGQPAAFLREARKPRVTRDPELEIPST